MLNPNQISPSQISIVVLVLAAAATDLRKRRIPNWLTLSGVCAGFLIHASGGGVEGVKVAASGMLLGFGAYFALYCLHAMGAGDVKLMAAAGAIIGPEKWVSLFIATALAGGVIALVAIVIKRRVRRTLWNVGFIVHEMAHLRPPHRRNAQLDVKSHGALRMPHGVTIAAGTAICLLSAQF